MFKTIYLSILEAELIFVYGFYKKQIEKNGFK